MSREPLSEAKERLTEAISQCHAAYGTIRGARAQKPLIVLQSNSRIHPGACSIPGKYIDYIIHIGGGLGTAKVFNGDSKVPSKWLVLSTNQINQGLPVAGSIALLRYFLRSRTMISLRSTGCMTRFICIISWQQVKQLLLGISLFEPRARSSLILPARSL